MRLSVFFVTAVALAFAGAAQAQSDGGEARDHFEAALANDCPQKQLHMLSARALRDGLDQYVEGLPQVDHDLVQKSERDHCSSIDAGAACVNLADLQAADQVGRMDELALSICGAFLRCRSEGDCDYAR